MARECKLIFAEDKCKGCGLCVSVCPRKILTLDSSKVNGRGYHPVSVTDETMCIGCGSCTLMCPDGVIAIYKV